MSRFRILLALFFVIACSGISGAAVLLDRMVAVVNQEVITWSDLYKNMEADASPQIKAMKEEDRINVFKGSEASYLESFINTRLQIQEANNLGMTVAAAEVTDAIEGIKKKYSMSDADFQASLKKEGFGFDEYKNKLRDQILVSKVVSQQVSAKIVVTEKEVDEFLASNREFSSGNEGYRISQIFLKKPNTSADRKTLEEKAASFISRIRAGESFADIARKYSEEPMSASGGDLGLIRREHLMKEFTEVLAGLQQGQVSMPFWSDRGLHIIRLEEKVLPKQMSEIREDARRELSGRLFTDRYNKWIKSLREKSFIDIQL